MNKGVCMKKSVENKENIGAVDKIKKKFYLIVHRFLLRIIAFLDKKIERIILMHKPSW